jgi:hypothetical protein
MVEKVEHHIRQEQNGDRQQYQRFLAIATAILWVSGALPSRAPFEKPLKS